MELYWRIDFQYACTGWGSEDVRQGSTGNDGIVKNKIAVNFTANKLNDSQRKGIL